MLTFEYLRWFHFVAKRNTFTATTRGVFQYILELVIERECDSVSLTQDEMCTVLNLSKKTLEKSLTILRQTGLVAYTRGKYRILPPAPTWCDKYLGRRNFHSIESKIFGVNSTQPKSQINSRATRQAVVKDTPPKGVSTSPQGNSPKPTVLPPRQTQAKPLTARRLLEIQRAIGVIPDIRLIRFASEHPDEPYIMEGGEGS